MVLEVSESVWPEQTGLLLPGTGVVGGSFTATTVVPAFPVHPTAEVAVTEYVPELIVAAAGMTGFWEAEEKLFGPFQL